MRTLLLAPFLLLALPDIAPNPRNRSGHAVAPRGTTEIAMRAEVVELVLHENHAEVKATFELENTGAAAEQLEVGFPTEAFPIETHVEAADVPARGSEARIHAFAASIDGKEIASERKEVEAEDPRRVHRHWVCWPMQFDGKQKRRVEVRYEVETRDPNYVRPFSPLEPRELIYVLKTGAGWKDVIGSARVILRCADDMDFARVEATTPAPTKKGEREWEWTFADFEPQEDVVIRYRVHADAAVAIARTQKDVAERPNDLVLQFDFAQNLEAVGRHEEAAQRYAQLVERLDAKQRGDKAIAARTTEDPLSFRAARAFAKAGKREEARAWAERAAKDLELRLLTAKRLVASAERFESRKASTLDLGFDVRERAKERIEQAKARLEAVTAAVEAVERLRAELAR